MHGAAAHKLNDEAKALVRDKTYKLEAAIKSFVLTNKAMLIHQTRALSENDKFFSIRFQFSNTRHRSGRDTRVTSHHITSHRFHIITSLEAGGNLLVLVLVLRGPAAQRHSAVNQIIGRPLQAIN